MAKKKPKFKRPRRSILAFAVVVLAVALVWAVTYFTHQHAVNTDKARFTQANKDVQTVASQIVAAVGQPQDRKDGGKCSYAHQEFSKGPLSCEVYSYLAYGVNSPDEVNAIVQKTLGVPALNGSPWRFKAVTEKPYQFIPGANTTENFITLRQLFDIETKSIVYTDNSSSMSCAISFRYFNSVYELPGYPNFDTGSSQSLLMDIDCSDGSQSPYYPIE